MATRTNLFSFGCKRVHIVVIVLASAACGGASRPRTSDGGHRLPPAGVVAAGAIPVGDYTCDLQWPGTSQETCCEVRAEAGGLVVREFGDHACSDHHMVHGVIENNMFDGVTGGYRSRLKIARVGETYVAGEPDGAMLTLTPGCEHEERDRSRRSERIAGWIAALGELPVARPGGRGATGQAKWTPRRIDGGEFRVALPGTPSATTVEVDLPGGRRVVRRFTLSTPAGAYLVAFVEVGELPKDDVERVLDAEIAGAVGAWRGTLLDASDIKDSNVTREVRIALGSGVNAAARFIYARDRLILLVAVGASRAQDFELFASFDADQPPVDP
jgi:hypothetical protein